MFILDPRPLITPFSISPVPPPRTLFSMAPPTSPAAPPARPSIRLALVLLMLRVVSAGEDGDREVSDGGEGGLGARAGGYGVVPV